MRLYQRLFLVSMCSIFLFSFLVFAPVSADFKQEKVDNVILMIPDGFSASYATHYRHYKGKSTIFDEMNVGMMRTYSANSLVTDSAAAATAMATGVKTNNGMIGISPSGKSLKTILEIAGDAHKATGLVVTSTLTHATPAAFVAKVDSRERKADIAKQMIGKVDVMLGGGRARFIPDRKGQPQDENLIKEAKKMGYMYVESRKELLELDRKKQKVLGLFAEGRMEAELERDPNMEPSLAEMTKVALETLSQNQNGFFLMVEGSLIDWAGHANDPAWAMKDTEAFEEAAVEVIKFAKEHPSTLVVIAGDHDSGGMSVGAYNEYDSKVDILRDVTATGHFMAKQINTGRKNIKEVFKQYANIVLTKDEVKRIRLVPQKRLVFEINEIISQRALVGWTTKVHTGVDVPIYASGPGAHLFSGLKDNTDIAKHISEAMNLEFPN